MAFPTFVPGLRSVNSGGGVTRGPFNLTPLAGRSNGFSVVDCRPPEYVPEYQVEYLNLAYTERWTLLGVRPIVRMEFILVDVGAGDFGLTLLRKLWEDGISSQTFAGLQFNLYMSNPASQWRGIRPVVPWNLREAGGKQTRGFSWSFEARCTSLLQLPLPDFFNSQW